MTVEDYLSFEERSQTRHEFVDGRVFVVESSTRRHNLIAGNLYALLRAAVKGGPCKAYMSDVKVRVEATNSFYYPDVLVSCDYFDSKSVYTDSPTLVVEVLSRSTAGTDRREKLFAYEKVTTLKEYLIVHQRTRLVQYHKKNNDGQWGEATELRTGASFKLESLPCTPIKLTVDEIYEDITYPGDERTSLEVREHAYDGYLGDESEEDTDDFDW